MIKFRQAVGVTAFLVLVGLLFTQVVVMVTDADTIEKVALPFFLTLLVSLLSSLNPQYRDGKSIGTHLMPAGIVAVGVLIYLGIKTAVSAEAMVWQQVPAVVFGAALSVLLINVLRKVTR